MYTHACFISLAIVNYTNILVTEAKVRIYSDGLYEQNFAESPIEGELEIRILEIRIIFRSI